MSRKPVIIAVVVIAVALVAAAIKWGVVDSMPNGDYYVQVDNGKVHELHPEGGVVDFTGGMKWEYELPAYDDEGGEKQLKFGTERQLREGAYLKLTVVPVQGVVGWEEVQLDQMPQRAQAAFR